MISSATRLLPTYREPAGRLLIGLRANDAYVIRPGAEVTARPGHGGVGAAATVSRPLMRRWTIRAAPESSQMSKYLPRRPSEITVRPVSRSTA